MLARSGLIRSLAVAMLWMQWSGAAQAALTYAQEVLADNPLAYYRLDETSGITAFDSSGNARHGVYSGVALGGTGAVPSNAAAGFNGTSSYVDLSSHVWGGTSAVSIEAWINVAGFVHGGFHAVVSALTGHFVHLQLNDLGGNNVAYTDSALVALPVVSPLPINTWRHVVLSVTSGNSRLYVDGVLIGTDTHAFTSVTSPAHLRIGSGFGGLRFFNGSIDEVAIYNTALTQADVTAHFNARNNVAAVPVPSSLALVCLGWLLLTMGYRRRQSACV